jgi:hypothetical protein
MDRPRISHIPPNELLKQLVGVHTLEDKVLVTKVVSCPAYSLYLSSKREYLYLDLDVISDRTALQKRISSVWHCFWPRLNLVQ